MLLDRRSLMKAGAASMIAGSLACPASAEDRALFRHAPLVRNPIARSFVRMPDAARLPSSLLLSPDGPHRMKELRGKVRIVSLWAEWCVPCLVEAKDLSRLRSQFGGPSFDILAILTAGRAALAPAQARDRLIRSGAPDLPTWVEPDGGRSIGQALAVEVPPHVSLPCNLLIDRAGRVRARSVGIGNDLPQRVGRSHWATPEAVAFVSALRDGALDRA